RRSPLGFALVPACLAVTVMARAAGHGAAIHAPSLLIAPPLAGLHIDVPFVPAPGLGLGLIVVGATLAHLCRQRSARRALARA
ncbi:MAG TPA: hypothetical protein VFE31_13305, partial [Opitutaceae bacterium]|nr:hypothetical protein [Opitutaceae bacterium]